MTISSGNLFESLPEDIPEELFTDIILGKNIKIERIVSKGHNAPQSGWYDQDEDEWVIVLKGEARLSFQNGEDLLLVTGSHISIPARTKHKVTWTTPNTETVWLAVHYR